MLLQNKHMESVPVTVAGATNVGIASASVASLVQLEDPMLQREITDEALRLALAGKLAGYQGITITRATSAAPAADSLSTVVSTGERVVATVNFDGLSACIAELVAAYDAATERLESLREPLAVLAEHKAELSPECQKAVTEAVSIVETFASDEALEEARQGAAPPVVEEEHDSSCSDAVDDEDDDDPAQYGYKPLLDEDEDDDAEADAYAARQRAAQAEDDTIEDS
jgi:hypothetical protein